MENFKHQKGFLMVEVLIAIVVISVALVSVPLMFMQSTKASSAGVEISTATTLAQKQIEMLKSQPATYWAAIPTSSTQSIAWQDTNEAMPLTKNNIAYNVTTTATTVAQDANMVKVTVKVDWSGTTISLVSLFSQIAL